MALPPTTRPRVPLPGDPDYDPDNPITGDSRSGPPKGPVIQDPNAPDGGGTDPGYPPDNPPQPRQPPIVQHPELRNPPPPPKPGEEPQTPTFTGPSQYFPPQTGTPYDPTPTGANVHDTGPADPNTDPFATIGGGVYMNGGWVPKNHPAAQAWLAQHPAGTPGDVTTRTPEPGDPVRPQTEKELMDAAMRAQILKLLNAKAPTTEELAQTPEAAAFRLTSQRGHEADLAQLAEEAAVNNYSGTPEQTAKARGLSEHRGEANAAFMGQLATQRLQMQREDVKAGIAAAQSQGQFEAAQALQLQLAEMDDAIRRLQLAQTKELTYAQIASNKEIAEASNNLQRYGIDVSRMTAQEQIALNRELGLSEIGFKYANLDYQSKKDKATASTGGTP